MKEVPKKQEEEVGGGLLENPPWCPPPGDIVYPQMPGCPGPLPEPIGDPSTV